MADVTEVLATDRVWLRAVEPADVPQLWALVHDPLVSQRWRTMGATVSPEEFRASLWSGVLVQHVAVDRHSGEPVAWLICYDANHRHQHASFAVVAFPAFRTTRALRDAIHLFVDYLFATWPLRQILVEVPEFNLSYVAPALREVADHVGSIPEYFFTMDRWWSLETFTIRRGSRLGEARDRIGRRKLMVEAGPFQFDIVEPGDR
ncbi:MAG: GNAT family protein [Acidimicrobiales bacterium]